MKYKELSYWFKGGLIGLVIGVLIFLIIAFFINKGDINLFIIGLFIVIGSLCGSNNPVCAWPVTAGICIIAGFIVGVIIGWILGKFKNKKRKK